MRLTGTMESAPFPVPGMLLRLCENMRWVPRDSLRCARESAQAGPQEMYASKMYRNKDIDACTDQC